MILWLSVFLLLKFWHMTRFKNISVKNIKNGAVLNEIKKYKEL